MSKISIIIPVYKVEKDLPDCLDSVLAQTFKDWEAICVNDGSPDKCGEILAEYAKKDTRIKVITQENQGVSSARNTGLKNAKGQYISFIDSDDAIAPAFLESLYTALQQNPQADFVWCGIEKGTDLPSWKETNKNSIALVNNPLEYYLLDRKPKLITSIWNKLYRREVLAGFEFPLISVGEDIIYLFNVLLKSKEALCLSSPLYFYRDRKGSFTKSAVTDSRIEKELQLTQMICDLFKNVDLKKDIRKVFNEKMARRFFIWGIRRLKSQSYSDFSIKIREKMKKLIEKQVYQPQYLSIKNRLISYFFLKKHPRLSHTQIVKIQGGLGNQMFQYAFSLNFGNNTKYDVSFFNKKRKKERGTNRLFSLCDWNIEGLQQKEILPNKLVKKFFFPPMRTEKDENIFDPNLLTYKEGYYVGYFQAPQYFDYFRSQLLQDFIPSIIPNPICQKLLDEIGKTNSVSLHIRRGDYVKLNNIYGVCDLEYYRQAVSFIAQKIPQPHFYIFSDDMNWVKENLAINYPTTYVEQKWDSDIWDIWLMKHCRHNIIANSTYSWWGAWLNENPSKIVIAPKHWFANGTKTDIVPDSWIRIGGNGE